MKKKVYGVDGMDDTIIVDSETMTFKADSKMSLNIVKSNDNENDNDDDDAYDLDTNIEIEMEKD